MFFSNIGGRLSAAAKGFIFLSLPLCSRAQELVLSGAIDQPVANDTISLQIAKDLRDPDNQQRYTVVPAGGRFLFKTALTVPGVLKMTSRHPAMATSPAHYYYIEPGDSIHVHILQDRLEFSGKGALKCQLQTEAMKRYREQYNKYPPSIVVSDFQSYPVFCRFADSMITYRLQLLDENAARLSPWARNILRVDFLVLLDYWRAARYFLLTKKFGKEKTLLDSLYTSTIMTSAAYTLLPGDSNINVPFFAPCLQMLYTIRLARESGFTPVIFKDFVQQAYTYINLHFEGDSRETLWLRFVRMYLQVTKAKEYVMACVEDYLSQPHPPYFKQLVKKEYDMARTLDHGRMAPLFRLPDSSGRLISLADFRGKVVLVDFWFTGCSGCATQAPFLKTVEEAFNGDSNVVFINISVDDNPGVWKKSLHKGTYTSGKGVSLNSGGSEAAVIADYNVQRYPTLFLINREGKIEYAPDPVQGEQSAKGLVRQIEYLLHPDE